MNINSIENMIDALPEGYSNYLKICLDPYHDKSIRFEGAPSNRSATSVTLCINQELSLGADDFNIDPLVNPTWDAHVTMYPFLAKHNMLSGYWNFVSTAYGNEMILNPTTRFQLYPLSVHGVPSGQPTYSMEDDGVGALNVLGLHNTAMTAYTASGVPASYARRCLRIVGESFEVIDESPEIYQQGACTVYRYPLDTSLNRALVVSQHPLGGWPNPSSAAPFVRQPHEIYSLKAPPSNPASAVLVAGAETWKSKEGAYVVGTQYVPEIPFKTCDAHRIVVDGVYPPTEPRWADSSTAAYLFGDASLQTSDYGASGTTPVATTTYSNVDACFPFNLSGAYFTNLSSTYGALRVRYRVYVEILTDPTDLTLVPLASPTLPFKQSLMETIMEIIAHQPAGVPQSWNPKGEAWRKILRTVGSVLQKGAGVGALIDPTIGVAMQATGTSIKKLVPSKNKKKPPGAKPAKGPGSTNV